MAKIVDIEGIGKKYAKTLKGAGIATTGQLLKQGATAKGRKEIAEKTGISPKLILEWTNHADLFRIKGVAEEYSDLLEEAGVDTVKELAQRNPANLHAKMGEVNANKVAELVEGFESPLGLELLSTVHWVIKNEPVDTLDKVVRQTYAWNERKRRFTPRQIGLAEEVLSRRGWTEKLGP